jgi:hypothetical protein
MHAIIDAPYAATGSMCGPTVRTAEKLGWLEQDWLNAQGLMDNYDCRSMITPYPAAHGRRPACRRLDARDRARVCHLRGRGHRPSRVARVGGALVALPYLSCSAMATTVCCGSMPRRYNAMPTTCRCATVLYPHMGLGDWYD